MEEKINEIIEKSALLAAACEGNFAHESTPVNQAIFKLAVEVQLKLQEIKNL